MSLRSPVDWLQILLDAKTRNCVTCKSFYLFFFCIGSNPKFIRHELLRVSDNCIMYNKSNQILIKLIKVYAITLTWAHE